MLGLLAPKAVGWTNRGQVEGGRGREEWKGGRELGEEDEGGWRVGAELPLESRRMPVALP